jgi:hypothetical protein
MFKSSVKMLSACKHLTPFEIFGILEDEVLVINKVVSEALCSLMEVQGVNCPFKTLPKFITSGPRPIQFESFRYY